jgi:dolichyl-phosphate-mannose-protein mannosyltransferase
MCHELLGHGRIPQVNRARRHWLFGLALAAAIAVRILVMLAFRPVIWFGGDSASYLATGLRLVPDPSRVGGYGFLLWLLRPLHSFVAVAAVQHAMGLAIGVLIYLLARRYGLPGWAATLATLPVFFDAYQLQLEQDMVPDISFAFLAVLALYLLLRWPRSVPAAAGAALALGVTAIFWPVGLALLAVVLVVLALRLLKALLRRQAGGTGRFGGGGWLGGAGVLPAVMALAGALACGAVPVLGYAAWFDVHEHQFTLTRSDGVFLWSRTMSFADCAVIRPPADELALCPPPGSRIASSLYIWDSNSPLLRMPGGRFSARTNSLALNFALRAIVAQPGGYATAVGHDLLLSFYWNRPVHPDAGIVDRYQFADASTAWVSTSLREPGGGTVAGDQAAYAGQASPTRAVKPFASWLVTYQKWVYLRGTLLGAILLGGLGVLLVRRRLNLAGLPWVFAVTILVVPPLTADFDLRYLVPAVPVACLAAVLACAPANRTWTTSPAATATSEADDLTTSLPSGSTSTASPDST